MRGFCIFTLTKEINTHMAKVTKKPLIGRKYGRLTIIEDLGYVNGVKKVLALCKCGTIKEYFLSNLQKKGHTTSCGCYRRENPHGVTHGLRGHHLYKIWSYIKTRCCNANSEGYLRYGANGVELCEEWLNNPEKFISWALDNGWRRGMMIDKDIKAKALGLKGVMYSPEWCTVVTPKENANAASSNRNMEYNSEIKSSAAWSEYFGISKATFWYRIKKCNWNIYDYVKKWGNKNER